LAAYLGRTTFARPASFLTSLAGTRLQLVRL